MVVSETIVWSRDMYVEYVTGTRQYRIPGAGDFHTEVPAAREDQVLSKLEDSGEHSSYTET